MQLWFPNPDLDVDHYKRTLTVMCHILIRPLMGVSFQPSVVKKIYPNPKTLLEHKKLTFQSEKGKEINKRMSGETCNWRQ